MSRDALRRIANAAELAKSPHLAAPAFVMQARVDDFNHTFKASDRATAPAEKVRLLEEAKAILEELKGARFKGIALDDLALVERDIATQEAAYRAAGFYASETDK